MPLRTPIPCPKCKASETKYVGGGEPAQIRKCQNMQCGHRFMIVWKWEYLNASGEPAEIERSKTKAETREAQEKKMRECITAFEEYQRGGGQTGWNKFSEDWGL